MYEVLEPRTTNGKICYLEIPAQSLEESSGFYHNVFGWHIRHDADGNVTFDDPTGHISGMWVLDRRPHTHIGLTVSIMVHSMARTLELVTKNHGKIIHYPNSYGGEVMALFADPANNIFCLYQHRNKKAHNA
jgi:predicted enzyme related to lactoylglutathione lyase